MVAVARTLLPPPPSPPPQPPSSTAHLMQLIFRVILPITVMYVLFLYWCKGRNNNPTNDQTCDLESQTPQQALRVFTQHTHTGLAKEQKYLAVTSVRFASRSLRIWGPVLAHDMSPITRNA